VTKFLDPKFSSRPTSDEYRENYEATFGKEAVANRNRPREKRQVSCIICNGPCGRGPKKHKPKGKAKTLRDKR
jgi:hypothetical protein